MSIPSTVEDFLRPLDVDTPKIHGLAKALTCTYNRLALESEEQFLSTPIEESLLRPESEGSGRYLAIDIGGTNLRVGFVEFVGTDARQDTNFRGRGNRHRHQSNVNTDSRIRRVLEKSWPIGEQLKHNEAEDLFAWIGCCIAEVVENARILQELPEEISLGVTFSFPMIQHTLSEATLMSMGKGFSLSENANLGKLLLAGYESCRKPSLPTLRITAIVNDAVATLVAFAYNFRSKPNQKAAMGLIVGTGCNATIPLALSKLKPSKRPTNVTAINDLEKSDMKVAVNTEWSINGTAAPLRELDFITKWDRQLDEQGETAGFMPFEYMTAGRYVGELGRLIILDCFTNHLHIPITTLPPQLLQRGGLTTTFLGNIGPHLSRSQPSLLLQLETELPPSPNPDAWSWTQEAAETVLKISKAIQIRAAAMTAAATIALLACADELHFTPLPTPLSSPSSSLPNDPVHAPASSEDVEELMVGYTGGCITHFQDYLADCQRFINEILDAEFEGKKGVPRVTLVPCHDGGVVGAGILAGTVFELKAGM
ncbi:Actin-like ATPase [Glarea lozoyensis ATCC 20868]|uniref:Phosphotransferase n=1 Tax=Glarea lozoyensis (strain ATCC 20868 / MF5171) TaxID=1116229 RepID=S3DDS3_GLAL2|nr:Actin-like ATPase [Glarea lozoyensis ATCC 20868]EPE35249.1 Actin-like ATPase [Glarea lozoyensis ATCC 20868]